MTVGALAGCFIVPVCWDSFLQMKIKKILFHVDVSFDFWFIDLFEGHAMRFRSKQQSPTRLRPFFDGTSSDQPRNVFFVASTKRRTRTSAVRPRTVTWYSQPFCWSCDVMKAELWPFWHFHMTNVMRSWARDFWRVENCESWIDFPLIPLPMTAHWAHRPFATRSIFPSFSDGIPNHVQCLAVSSQKLPIVLIQYNLLLHCWVDEPSVGAFFPKMP